MPVYSDESFPSLPATAALVALLLLPLLVSAPLVSAQEADNPEGCCEFDSGGCISPSDQNYCVEKVKGQFFAGHECGGGEEPECVLVHPVFGRASFQMELDCGQPSSLVGVVGVDGEVKVARGGSAGGTIPIELISLELSGTPSAFGPTKLEYREPAPPTGESDLSTGVLDLQLAPFELELSHPGCPPQVETGEPLHLTGEEIFSFPPVGGRVEALAGEVPLLADGEPVGSLSGFALDFGGNEQESDCPVEPRPAATLLVPYFEVDLADNQGPTTLFDVTNHSDSYVVARVVLWTDLGVPSLTFWLYLSPSDVQSVNLRDVFAGRLPDTSAVLADLQRPILDFEPCSGDELSASLTADQIAFLTEAHTGGPLPLSDDSPPQATTAWLAAVPLCAGMDRGDATARGYVTIDVVNRCAYAPNPASYQHADALADPFLLAGANVLWGNYFWVNGRENFAQGETMVHRPFNPLLLDPGDDTFYGRYVHHDAVDGRLPLPSHYQARFLEGGPFDGGTRLVVWRDNLSAAVEPIPCGTQAPWQPLGEGGVVAWDEGEDAVELAGLSSICPEASGVTFACELQGLPFPFGFLDLDLAHGDGTPAQAAVVPVMRARGRFGVGQRAVPVDNRCNERKAISLKPFDQALNACEYEVIGFTDRCPHGHGDRIFVGCIDGRCPLVGPQGDSAVALCPDRDCGLGLRLTDFCKVRETGPRYKRVKKCG